MKQPGDHHDADEAIWCIIGFLAFVCVVLWMASP